MSSRPAGVAVAARLVREALNARGISYALVGGLAVSTQAAARFTRDVDLAVAVDSDEQADALVFSLRSAGFSPVASVEQEANARLATVCLESGSGINKLEVDLLFASSGIEHEVVRDARPLEVLSGLILPVASVWHLIALKVLSRDDVHRPQDQVDLAALLREASDEDLERAGEALALITKRGFGRKKRLGRELADAIQQFRSA